MDPTPLEGSRCTLTSTAGAELVSESGLTGAGRGREGLFLREGTLCLVEVYLPEQDIQVSPQLGVSQSEGIL